MANQTISSQNTNMQDVIKHFNTGVESWSVFGDFYDNFTLYLGRLNFLCGAGDETDRHEEAMYEIFKMIPQARNEAERIRDTALRESNEAGGNDIYTISMNETLNLKQAGLGLLKAEESEVQHGRKRFLGYRN